MRFLVGGVVIGLWAWATGRFAGLRMERSEWRPAVQRFDPGKLLLSQVLIGTAIFVVVSLVFEPSPTRWTVRLATSIAYQGVLVAGFNFVVNLWLLRRYRPSALAGFFLTQPIFGVLAAAVVPGDPLTLDLLLASAAVAVGIGLTSR